MTVIRGNDGCDRGRQEGLLAKEIHGPAMRTLELAFAIKFASVPMPGTSIAIAAIKRRHHMKAIIPVGKSFAGWVIVALCALAFSGCDYTIPITPGPTRQVDAMLLGNWGSRDGKEKLKVRKLGDSLYLCSYNGDLFQAFHSDVGKAAFISVQDIDSAERKYVYLAYTLSADGKQLALRAVSTKVIPKEIKDSAVLQRLLEANSQNPALFGEEVQFSKEKSII